MDLTPGQARTAAATAARKRIKYERLMAELAPSGLMVPTADVQRVRDDLAEGIHGENPDPLNASEAAVSALDKLIHSDG